MRNRIVGVFLLAWVLTVAMMGREIDSLREDARKGREAVVELHEIEERVENLKGTVVDLALGLEFWRERANLVESDR